MWTYTKVAKKKLYISTQNNATRLTEQCNSDNCLSNFSFYQVCNYMRNVSYLTIVRFLILRIRREKMPLFAHVSPL